MKRNMDLVRSIMLRLEESERLLSGEKHLEDLAEKDVLVAHLTMLEDAGFLEHKNWKPHPHGVILRMGWRITWAGHEFLDTVRDPEIWKKTKVGAQQLGSWTVKILGDMATGYIKAKALELGLPM